MRGLIGSGVWFVLGVAFNLSVGKYGSQVPDGVIAACWLLPFVPIAYLVVTHQWYKDNLRTKKKTTIIATVIVALILVVTLGSAGYRAWKLVTKKSPEQQALATANQASHVPQVSQTPVQPDLTTPIPNAQISKKPLAERPESKVPLPESSPSSQSSPTQGHVGVHVGRGATWISTDDKVYEPDGIGVENEGEIISKDLQVNPPQALSPIAAWDQKPVNWQESEGQVLETQVTFTVDHAVEIPAFSVKCDRPCQVRHAAVVGMNSELDYLKSYANSEIAGAVFLSPRPLSSGIEVEYLISGMDGTTPLILGVDVIPPDNVPSKDR